MEKEAEKKNEELKVNYPKLMEELLEKKLKVCKTDAERNMLSAILLHAKNSPGDISLYDLFSCLTPQEKKKIDRIRKKEKAAVKDCLEEIGHLLASTTISDKTIDYLWKKAQSRQETMYAIANRIDSPGTGSGATGERESDDGGSDGHGEPDAESEDDPEEAQGAAGGQAAADQGGSTPNNPIEQQKTCRTVTRSRVASGKTGQNNENQDEDIVPLN